MGTKLTHDHCTCMLLAQPRRSTWRLSLMHAGFEPDIFTDQAGPRVGHETAFFDVYLHEWILFWQNDILVDCRDLPCACCRMYMTYIYIIIYYYYIFIFIQGHPYRPIGLLTGCPNQVHNWMRRSWSDVALRISGGAEFHLTAAKYDSGCKPKRRETLGRTRPLDTCERVRRAVRWVVETERRQNRSLRRGLICPEIQRNTRV